jgi:hypothetical protein
LPNFNLLGNVLNNPCVGQRLTAAETTESNPDVVVTEEFNPNSPEAKIDV